MTWTKARYTVYRVFDQADALLYVGITVTLATRMRTHRYQSPWFPQAAYLRVQRYDCGPEAIARELELIVTLQPPFNKSRSPYSMFSENHIVWDLPMTFLPVIEEPGNHSGRPRTPREDPDA